MTSLPTAIRAADPVPRVSPRRRKILLLLAVTWLILAGLAGAVLLNGQAEPSTPLGATATVPGGVGRINGIIPLETDGWIPAENSAALNGPLQPGAHRVRVLLELTATEPRGLRFTAADYSITGLGTDNLEAAWSAPASQILSRGESLQATLVFEIPDKAIALVLEGADGGRLSLGVGHHTGS